MNAELQCVLMNSLSFARFSLHSVHVADFAKSVPTLGGWRLDLIPAVCIRKINAYTTTIYFIWPFILLFCFEHMNGFNVTFS